MAGSSLSTLPEEVSDEGGVGGGWVVVTARDEYARMEQWAFEVGRVLQAQEHTPSGR